VSPAQGSGLCSTLVYKTDKHVCSLLVQVVCCNFIQLFLLCNLIYGGDPSWWSFGYPWILECLDERYDRTISHKKLRDYVDDFPQMYQAINEFIQKDSLCHFQDDRAYLSFVGRSLDLLTAL
jgi:hypothetical protein